jgi:hypothetical protein
VHLAIVAMDLLDREVDGEARCFAIELSTSEAAVVLRTAARSRAGNSSMPNCLVT